MARKELSASLQTRMSASDKLAIETAARLRRLSQSEYVRQVLVRAALKEIEGEKHRVIEMTPEEQLEFWEALEYRGKATPARKKLAKLIRGEE